MTVPTSAGGTVTRFALESTPGPRVLIDGRWRDYFAGTGYLGLQGHAAIVQAGIEALQRYGLTTATSRGGYGEHAVYRAVEAAATQFWGVERALYVTSAYLGNAILLQGLRGEYDRVFIDEASHTSAWDGARAAGAPLVPFHHLDPEDLARQCRTHLQPRERPLVLSDGIFPISGALAPAPAYLDVLARYDGGRLCLDDAHASGVLGAHGRGVFEHFAIDNDYCHATHTLSKALGGFGGLLVGSAGFVAALCEHSAIPVAASPPPLPVAQASAVALDLAGAEPERRQRLGANVAYARAAFRALGWPLANTPVPILCLGARPGLDLARLQQELFARDLCVAHVTRYSSTPPGGALRIAIFATHTIGQIDRLAGEMEALM